MRNRKKAYTQFELSNNPYIINDATNNIGNWSKIFNNSNPIHIEIGAGKCDFISGMCIQQPNINYIGIEKEKEIIAMGARTLQNRNVLNGYLILAKAENLLQYFNEGEISKIHLNFSDPWPKNRTAKRRLTYSSFLEIYKKLLPYSGLIELKTDNEPFFNFSLNELKIFGCNIVYLTRNLHLDSFHTSGKNIVTEYEAKFSSEGKPIFRLIAEFNF